MQYFKYYDALNAKKNFKCETQPKCQYLLQVWIHILVQFKCHTKPEVQIGKF